MKKRTIPHPRTLVSLLLMLLVLMITMTLGGCGSETAGDPTDTQPEQDGIPTVLAYDDYFNVDEAALLLSSDESIVEVLDGNTLHAVGIGTAEITSDDKTVTVTVEKAKLAVILCIGQSNMTVISTGNEDLAVKPARGTAYWGTLNNTRSLSVVGVKGLFGAFADQYYKATGEKCLLIQAAHGGASIGLFQTKSDSLGNAMDIYNDCAQGLEKYRDRYDIVRAGYIWLQGETDCRIGMSAESYLAHFYTMHNLLNSNCKNVVDGADKPFTFTGILAVRSWSGKPDYIRPDNIVFSGPRVAQYAMCLNDSIKVSGKTFDTSDIHLISNITENWYSDDSVKEWFASDAVYYEEDRGITKMIGKTEAAKDALMPPYISSASNTTYPDQHYLQKGYNEMGGDAGFHLAQILMAKDAGKSAERTAEDIVLRSFDGKKIYRDDDTAVLTLSEAVLVPASLDHTAILGDVTMEFTSKDCPNAKIDRFGKITGLTNKKSGELVVLLNGKKAMSVTVVMDDPYIVEVDFTGMAEGSQVYLSDLIGTDKCLYWRVNMADSNTANPQRTPGKDVNYTEQTLSVSGTPYEKGIGLHPQSDKDGVIEFDISGYDCNRFYAIVGSPQNTTNGNGTICSVEIKTGDGKYEEIAKTKTVGGATFQVLDFDITDADCIRLVVNNNGNYNSDSTTWAYAMIYRKN
ncbi:MAG: hypothetical protein E7632_08310 [Ruminococcaceae bacterium]|nr:hypothetical protein [Oscillospiraceae bacterium]